MTIMAIIYFRKFFSLQIQRSSRAGKTRCNVHAELFEYIHTYIYYLYSDWTKSSHLALAVYRVEYIPEQSQEEQGKQSVEV